MKTALVFGATGLTGSALTDMLPTNQHYERVKVFVRKPRQKHHEKVTEIIDSLQNPDTIKDQIIGDDLFICLGTTLKKAGSKEAQTRIDLDLPVKIARLAAENGVKNCIVVSSIGASASSKTFYLRLKGKMEEAIATLPFEKTVFVRPSFLMGDRKEFRFGEMVAKFIMRIFGPLLRGKLKKYRGIHVKKVAKAMLVLANNHIKGVHYIESDHLQELGG